MKKITRTLVVKEVKYTLFDNVDESIDYRDIIMPKDYSKKDRKLMESLLFPRHTVIKSETVDTREITCSMPLNKFFDMADKKDSEEMEED